MRELQVSHLAVSVSSWMLLTTVRFFLHFLQLNSYTGTNTYFFDAVFFAGAFLAGAFFAAAGLDATGFAVALRKVVAS